MLTIRMLKNLEYNLFSESKRLGTFWEMKYFLMDNICVFILIMKELTEIVDIYFADDMIFDT